MKSIVQLVLISSQNYTLTLGCLVISRALQQLNSIIIMTHDRPRKKERRKAEIVDFRVWLASLFAAHWLIRRQYSSKKLTVETVDNPFQYQILCVSSDNGARATISH